MNLLNKNTVNFLVFHWGFQCARVANYACSAHNRCKKLTFISVSFSKTFSESLQIKIKTKSFFFMLLYFSCACCAWIVIFLMHDFFPSNKLKHVQIITNKEQINLKLQAQTTMTTSHYCKSTNKLAKRYKSV